MLPVEIKAEGLGGVLRMIMAFRMIQPRAAKISLSGSGRPIRKDLGAGPFDAGATPCTSFTGIYPR